MINNLVHFSGADAQLILERLNIFETQKLQLFSKFDDENVVTVISKLTSTMQQWTPGFKFKKTNKPKVKNPAN